MSSPGKSLAILRVYEDVPSHRLDRRERHPAAQVLVALCLIVTAASFGKYQLWALLPLFLYPLYLLWLGGTSPKLLVWRLLPVLPLVLGVGILNPWFDAQPVPFWGSLTLRGGWVSFGSISLRGLLCVSTALLLVALLGIRGIATALVTFRLPEILMTQFLLTLRYLRTLAEEAGRMVLAYRLRAPERRGVGIRDCGSLLGQWLLRTFQRADRVYQAMQCRGYRGHLPVADPGKFNGGDLAYVALWWAFFMMVRWIPFAAIWNGLAPMFTT